MPQQDRGICLCILLNGPDLRSVPLLRRLYEGRFREIRFLAPLARGAGGDVLTVYRGPAAGPAFVADHVGPLRALGCAHYLLIREDLLLSPWLDEAKLPQALAITLPGDGFVHDIQPFPGDSADGLRHLAALWRLLRPDNPVSGSGFADIGAILAALPPAPEAALRAEPYDTPQADTSSPPAPYAIERPEERLATELVRALLDDHAPAQSLAYPLGWSADGGRLCLVPRSALADFAHYAGVLAAAGLPADIVAPSALMLSCARVQTLAKTYLDAGHGPALEPMLAMERLLGDPKLLCCGMTPLGSLAEPDDFSAVVDLLRADPAMLAAALDEAAVIIEWPDFDPDIYLELNPDTVGGPFTPYTHFRRFGLVEGRLWQRPPAGAEPARA